MRDPMNHSEEIWRTFAVEQPQLLARDFIEKYCKEQGLLYSYQNYGSGPEYFDSHMSFRIAFPTIEALTKFREEAHKFLGENTEEEYYDLRERGYDEQAGVKMAYVLGTELYNNVMGQSKMFKKNWYEHLLLMFHGFFNDLGWSYDDERRFYLYCMQRLLDPGEC